MLDRGKQKIRKDLILSKEAKIPEKLFPAAHYFGGIISTFLSTKYPVASIFLFLGFFIYEVIEFVQFKDMAWKDVKEFVIGLCAGIFLRVATDFICSQVR